VGEGASTSVSTASSTCIERAAKAARTKRQGDVNCGDCLDLLSEGSLIRAVCGERNDVRRREARPQAGRQCALYITELVTCVFDQQ